MKKKMETSKKVLLASYIIAMLLTAVVVIGTFIGADTGNVTQIALAAFAEVSVCNGFYLHKSYKENVPKIIAGMSDELKKQIDVNQLLNNN